MMQAQIQDKSSVAYQKLAWEALKKSINGLINKVCMYMHAPSLRAVKATEHLGKTLSWVML